MKKFKKGTAIFLSVLFGVVIVVGLILTFIPMTVGVKTFVSFSGGVNVSSDIVGGLYGEFQIKNGDEISQDDIADSLSIIREVFEDDGFMNVNVYAVGKTKIKVQISYPRGGRTFADAYSSLSNVGSGAFSLRDKYSEDEAETILKGSEHVTDISVFSNNGTNFITIKFDDEGKKIYEDLCKAGSLYLAIGTTAQNISISDVQIYDSLTLTDKKYTNLKALERQLKIGCMKIEVDSQTAVINTMSASLSAGESQSSPSFANFKSSTLYILLVVSLCLVIALGLAVFIYKFGLFSILIVATFLLNLVLFMILLCLMPSVEVGYSGFVLIILCLVLTYTFAFNFANRVKQEYALGRSLSASLETAFKKQLAGQIISLVTMFLSSLIFFALSFGEFSSFAIIFAICSFLAILTNLLIIPLFVKICISFEGFGLKLFKLKKRSGILDSATIGDGEITADKEAGK